MSIILEILEDLWNTNLTYKGMRVNIFGVPKANSSFSSTLSRMKSRGLVKKDSDKWSITDLGKRYLERKKNLMIQFDSPFEIHSPRNLLLMFDIPEKRSRERYWFRTHLKKFNYIMIQKSVWVGPSPLSKEFKDYIKEIKLSDFIKTFKLAKPYKIKHT